MQVYPGDWMTFGAWGLVGLLVMVVFWGLVIAAIVLGIRWLLRADERSRYGAPPPPPPAQDPMAILRERYARGEIDEEEYERRRKTLGG